MPRSTLHIPQAQALEDLFNDLSFFNKRNNSYLPAAFWTDQRIILVNFLDKTRPILMESFAGRFRLQNAGNLIISIGFLSFPHCNFAVIAVIANQLLTFQTYYA